MYNSGIKDTIFIKARAKINLNLQVLEKRQDNYHNIESIFQKINIYDELFLSRNETNDLIINSNIKELENEDNIIYKAYVKLKEKYSQINGITVNLHKRIPMQAGMAGGSTDCVAFIVATNRLYNLNMNMEEFKIIGSSLGADVVPCFYNMAVKANGIGDKIEKINTDFLYYILIVKPPFSFSTKEMYDEIDNNVKSRKSDFESLNNIVKALKSSNIELLANNLYNTFEEIVIDKIQDIKNELVNNGAVGTLMTGSGSAIFGLFKSKDDIRQAYKNLNNKYEIYLTTSYNSYREEKL